MAAEKEKPKPIEITSVRNNRKSITIGWKQGSDEYPGVIFHDNPRKSFYAALDALVPHVVTLAEFDKSDKKHITATGITVRAKGDGAQALIVAQKKLDRNGRVLNIATPLLSMYADKKNEGADHMTEAEAAAIEKVITEAKKYVRGDREQGQIEFVDEDKPKKDAGDNTEQFPAMSEPGAGEPKS